MILIDKYPSTKQVHAKHWIIPILNFLQKDKNSTEQSVAIIVIFLVA